MRRVTRVLCGLAATTMLVACGGGGSLPGSGSAAVAPLQSKLPKFLRVGHTPLPPKHRLRVTQAMRERAKKGGWQETMSVGPFANGADTAMLMTDGTVFVHDYCTSTWLRLTPDSTGSYLNGKWSTPAAMPSDYTPLYFASAILPDGKLIANGGEYNTSCITAETNLGAIYDPVANSWTPVVPPSGWPKIGDGQSAVLANGTYLLGNCCTSVQAEYDEGSSTWTQVGTGKDDPNSEEGWTLLRSGKLLDADVFAAPNSEEFNPSKGSWLTEGDLPVNLTQASEIGPQIMRPNDTVIVVGANGETAIFAEKTGKWTQGPNLPKVNNQQLDVADGPGVVLTDGEVLVAASPGIYISPMTMVLFNGKTIQTTATPPDAVSDSSFNVRLLMLPTGQVLETDASNDVEIYTSGHAAEAGIGPVITTVPASLTPGSTYTLKGKRLNGMTQNNFYGDDAQYATNYPLVRITNEGSGKVVYARTHNFSTMAVGSSATATAEFDVPSTIASGQSTLVVVTNGIPSPPVTVTISSKR